MTKWGLSVFLVAAGFVGACANPVQTVDTDYHAGETAEPALTTVDPDKYRPPDGFMGFPWGTHLNEIPQLKIKPDDGVSVAANYAGKVTDVRIFGCDSGGETAGPCEISQDVQGAGSYVLATYYRDYEPSHPFPGVDARIALYYFCARTSGSAITKHVRKRLELCGGEVLFNSEAPDRRREGDTSTGYDRVVDMLTNRHGRHDDFSYLTRVIVEDEQGRTNVYPEVFDLNYDPLYWCRKSQTALYPTCAATITLDYHQETEYFRVLYATGAMYRFAEALDDVSEEKIPLYERLNGKNPDGYKSKRKHCTGSHLCGESKRSLTERELDVLRPDPGG